MAGKKFVFSIEGDASKAIGAVNKLIGSIEKLQQVNQKVSNSAQNVANQTSKTAGRVSSAYNRMIASATKYAAVAALAKGAFLGPMGGAGGGSSRFTPIKEAAIGLIKKASESLNWVSKELKKMGVAAAAAGAKFTKFAVGAARSAANLFKGINFEQKIKNFNKGFMTIRQGFADVTDAVRLASQSITNVGRSLMFFVSLPLAGFFGSMVNGAINFEDALVRVQKTTGVTSDELLVLRENLREIAKQSMLSHVDLAKIAEVIGQMGVQSIDSITSLTRTFEMFSVATDIAADSVARELGRIANAFGWDLNKSTIEVTKLANTINYLENTTASSASEIMTSLQKFSQGAALLNITAAEAAGLSASLVAMGLSEQEAGTALRRMSSQLVKNADRVAELMGANEKYIDQDAVLKALNEDAVGVWLDIAKAADQAREKQDKNAESLAALIQVADERGGRALAALSSNIGLVEENLANANAEWSRSTSLVEEYNRAMLSTKSQMQVFKNNINDVGITIGDVLLPVINEIIQVAIPAIQMLADYFKGLSKETQMMVMAFAAGLVVIGPFLFFIGQLSHAITLALMGIGQLVRLVPMLTTGFLNAGKAIAFLSRILFSWPGLILTGIVAVMKILAKWGVDVAGFFTNLGESAKQWGENMAKTFASGFIAGAIRFVTRAINYVANLIASFFRGSSPPEAGPLSTIDRWGAKVMEAYLEGFKSADFSILSEIGSIIENILTRGISQEALPNALKRVAKIRLTLAKLIEGFNTTGLIDQGMLNRITSGLGAYSDNLKKIITLWLEYNRIQQRLKDIENRRKKVNKEYLAQLKEIAGSNLSGAQKVEAIRALQRGRDDQLRALDEEEEGLQEQSDIYKEQLDMQKQMVDAMSEQDNLMTRIADAIKALADAQKEMGGGAGGGGLDDMFGELDEDIEKAKTALGEAKEEFDTLVTKLSLGKKKLGGFFDGFLGKERKQFPYMDDLQSTYDIMYNLGERARKAKEWFDKARTSIEGFAETATNMFKGGEGGEGGFPDIGEWVSNLELVQGFLAGIEDSGVMEVWAELVPVISDAFKDLVDWILRLAVAFGVLTEDEAVAAGGMSFLGIVAHALGWVLGLIIGIIGDIIAVILTFASLIINVAGKAITGLIAFVAGIVVTAAAMAGEIITAIQDGLTNGFDGMLQAVITAAITLWNALIGAIETFLGISSPSTVFFDIAVNTVQGIIDGITSMISALLDTGKELFFGPDGIITYFTSGEFKDYFLEIGKEIVGGIIKGLEEKWTRLSSWFSEKVTEIPGWVRAMLGIHSPSKVFEKIGEQTFEGFLLGLDNKSKELENLVGNGFNFGSSEIHAAMRIRDLPDSGVRAEIHFHNPVVREEEDLKKLARQVSDIMAKGSYNRIQFGGNASL